MPLLAALLLSLIPQQPTVLAELPEELKLEGAHTVFAPGGHAAALLLPEGQGLERKWRLWHEGSTSEAYDFLDSLRFSEDGRHLAYRRGQVLEGERQSWEAVLDGRADRAYDWVGPIALSPQGTEIAYWAGESVRHDPKGGVPVGVAHSATGRNGGEYFIVRGGKEAEERCRPTPERFAPVYRADGKEIAHQLLLEDGLFIRVGKKDHGPYLDASQPVYAPQGKTCGWVGLERSGRGAIVIGKKEFAAGAEALGAPAFAGKGRDFAFPTKEDGKLAVSYDEELVGPSFGRLGKITLSEDGKHIAYVASTSVASMSVSIAGHTIVLDELMLLGNEAADSDRVTWSLVLDGEIVSGGWNFIGVPVFSANGETLAVPVRQGKEWRLLTLELEKDGPREGLSDSFDAVGPPRFTQDGAVRFGARRDRSLLQIELAI